MAQGVSASRERTILPSDCRPGRILFLRGRESSRSNSFLESGLRVECLDHPVLIIQKVPSKPGHVKICIVGDRYGRTILRADSKGSVDYLWRSRGEPQVPVQ